MGEILIVDDNAQNLYLARFLLEQAGYKITEAENGEEAVALCKDNNYKLVLMDIQMPVMDGLTATKIIKDQINEKLLIIALTAKAMEGDRENILQSGFDGYIKKPIAPDTFVALVEAHLL